jgi:hypothetical protein
MKSADIYDPATNRFLPTGDMIAARHSHVSEAVVTRGRFTLQGSLPEQTLVAGGLGSVGAAGSTSYVPTAEIFSEGTFHTIGSMNAARAGATATMVTGADRIVVLGGVGHDETEPGHLTLASAEYLTPIDAGAFSYTFTRTGGRMVFPRVGHTATAIRAFGRWPAVLIAGGGDNTSVWKAEVYVARDDDFAVSEPIQMSKSRIHHASALLNDGRVLVCGGNRSSGGTSGEWNQAELFDPRTFAFSESEPVAGSPTTFRSIGSMHGPRADHTATTLPDGRVLIAGGGVLGGVDRQGNRVVELSTTAELFDPATLAFTVVPGALVTPRTKHTATPLGDGRVLLAGGLGAGPNGGTVLDSGEIFDPRTGAFTAVANTMTNRRVYHAAAPI